MNKAKLKALIVQYGSIAVYTYFFLFVVVLAGFALAISTGLKTDGSLGRLGILGAAWMATKLTQPVRIVASVALTPIVARLFNVQKKIVVTGDGCPPGA
jgi:hypothetical protein